MTTENPFVKPLYKAIIELDKENNEENRSLVIVLRQRHDEYLMKTVKQLEERNKKEH